MPDDHTPQQLLLNAVSELLYNREHLDLADEDRTMLEDAYLAVEAEIA